MNFRDFDNLLMDSRAGSRAAECHGFLCGFFCVNQYPQADTFKKYLLADTMDQEMFVKCYEKIVELADEVNTKISAGDYSLQLMLPDDNSPMSERGTALIQWCEGFLSGLGIGGLTGLELLSIESREVIEDFYKICRLDVDDMDEGGEDEESAFTELTEYVRMGAILLHEELGKAPVTDEPPQVLH